MPITTLDDLRTHLQWAIELEHSTIPPYLCALYSIKTGHNREATEAITSVFIEEMLHMTLAAKGAQGKKMTLKYQAVYETGKPEGWPGPGIINEGFTKDDTQWNWWLYWRQLMNGEI